MKRETGKKIGKIVLLVVLLAMVGVIEMCIRDSHNGLVFPLEGGGDALGQVYQPKAAFFILQMTVIFRLILHQGRWLFITKMSILHSGCRSMRS